MEDKYMMNDCIMNAEYNDQFTRSWNEYLNAYMIKYYKLNSGIYGLCKQYLGYERLYKDIVHEAICKYKCILPVNVIREYARYENVHMGLIVSKLLSMLFYINKKGDVRCWYSCNAREYLANIVKWQRVVRANE